MPWMAASEQENGHIGLTRGRSVIDLSHCHATLTILKTPPAAEGCSEF